MLKKIKEAFLKIDWKNYKVWVGLFSLIPIAVKALGMDMGIIPSDYEEVVNAILVLLVAMGILTNPQVSVVLDRVEINDNISAPKEEEP